MAKNKYKAAETKKEKKKGKLFTIPKWDIKGGKFLQFLGLFLVLFSFFLLISFISYLFTWQNDQDKLAYSFSEYFFDSSIVVENWLGKLGAALAHQFIYKWFGVISFLFVLLFLITGAALSIRVSFLPIIKTYKHSFFHIIWWSVALGFFSTVNPILGGAFGYHINNWLVSFAGNVGTGAILIFSASIYAIVTFSLNIENIKNLFKSEEKEESEEVEEETDELKNTLIETEENIENEESEEEIKEEEVINEPKEEIKEEPIEINEVDEKGIGFSVEKVEDKEKILSDDELNSKVEEFGEYDPTLDLSSYQFPHIDLLKDYGTQGVSINKEELEENKNKIVGTLENYNIKIEKIKATIGPTVTLYEIVPAPGVRISKIKNLEDDIALSLSALGIRIIAPIPGKGTIGIEVPNQDPQIVSMRSVIASEKFQNAKMELPVVIGKTISNENFVFDLTKMPHLLMAGATGQGKSVGLNAILTSLVYKKHPSQLKFVLVDPKKVELTLYNKIERHFLAKLPDTEDAIITDNQKVINTLNSLCIEMDERYELLKNAMVRNIKEYNAKFIARKLNPEKGHRFLPYIVLVVDEFADLIMTAGREVETPICRLAQLARAIGIHLIIATQRPSANIITGVIKANFPGRIAFRVTSQIDSRTILDSGGAEQLIGRGDLLISQGSDLTRVQCAFVDTPEVEEICEFIGSQRAYSSAHLLPEYTPEGGSSSAGEVNLDERDALFEEAAKVIVQAQQGSTSLIQRKLKLGYNRAGRIIDQLEAAGIVGPFEGSKARQVLIADELSLEQFLKDLSGIE